MVRMMRWPTGQAMSESGGGRSGIPGRPEEPGPESILRSGEDYGFRARSLRSRPGMTTPSPPAPLGVEIVAHRGQIARRAGEHALERRRAAEGRVRARHPGIAALGLGEEVAQRLMDAHEVAEAPDSVRRHGADLAALPAIESGGARLAEQHACLD